MYIKNLEKAETLPYRSSMRRSSGYNSWDDYHNCGFTLYQWTDRFLEKHVGEYYNNVYSLYRKSLKKKHLDSETIESMIETFKDRFAFRNGNWRYWYSPFEVDDDGIIRKVEKKRRKEKDKVINYGEPITTYTFNKMFLYLVPIIQFMFGYDKTKRFLIESFSFNEIDLKDGMMYRFNNYCYKHGIKDSRYHYGTLHWYDLWVKHINYPYSETLKYRSAEYYKYHYEMIDRRKVRMRLLYEEKVEKFNKEELNHIERKPIFIG